jgi:signal transduction histidine kinase
MDAVKIFYDSKGAPEFVQVSHEEYERIVKLAKDSMEQKKTLAKINDLIRVFL